MPFIASGSYGCVFRPHLKCKSKKHYSDGVGKVFYTEEDFESEKDIAEKVKNIDPKNKFTLPMYEACETDKNYRPSDQISKCKTVNMNGKSFQQLIYKYGGKSLLEVLQERKGSLALFKKTFLALHNILDGISKVNAMGYIHQDIKPDNILMASSLKPGTKDPNAYIIDFGILDRKDNIYNEENTAMLKYDYPYFPPEYKLYVKNYSTFNAFYNAVINNYYYGFKFNGRTYYLNEHFSKLGLGLNHRALCKEAYDKPEYDTDKIDIFSFGIILFMVFLWAPIPKKVEKEVKEYIAGLINPVVSRRLSSTTALQVHKAILKKMGSRELRARDNNA